jgi:leucyl/phenylalanyl-tRNA---protein transferase
MSDQPPTIGSRESPHFPPVARAGPDGLLAWGGQLTPEWLTTAYTQGIFPWPVVDGRWEVLAWFSPDPRAVLELDRFHVSRRLQRRLRRGEFRITFDRCFAAVVAGCAAPRRGDAQTWITADMAAAYGRLHELGIAHSVEVWQAERLVGGLYGVGLGGFFAGESMFHRVRDASKAALARLVERLRQRGYVLFDVQQPSAHLQPMGAVCLPREVFLQRLRQAVSLPVSFGE